MVVQKKGIQETFYISHAILIISGHWETSEAAVNAVSGPSKTIYDFYGFPDKMYQLKYSAPSSPELTNRVKQLLINSGFKMVHVDKECGLDHGAWVPLMLMYPDVDILEALLEGRYADVNEYAEKALHAQKAHPSPDHFYPLHVALGAAGENTRDMIWGCLEGLAQALRVFNGVDTIPAYKVASISMESMLKVHVKPETPEVRPFIVCAVLRGVTFDEA
ncbi:hypothetical protein ACS0TY_020882 [Phlomoides rotata]